MTVIINNFKRYGYKTNHSKIEHKPYRKANSQTSIYNKTNNTKFSHKNNKSS